MIRCRGRRVAGVAAFVCRRSGIVWCLALGLAACEPRTTEPGEPQGPTPQTPQNPGAVQGTVSDAFGKRLNGVVVSLSGPSSHSATTGATGQFSFPSVPPGSYQAQLTRAAFQAFAANVSVASGQTAQLHASLRAESQPFAAVVITRHVSRTPSPNRPGYYLDYVIEADVAVMDADARPIASMTAGSFQIPDYQLQPCGIGVTPPCGYGWAVRQQSVSAIAGAPAGSYAALLLFDQSGSILSTDPADSRLQAGKVFVNALGSGDAVQVAAFASAGRLPFHPVTLYGQGFTSNGPGYFGTLDHLADLVGGGTPLYQSTYSMINHTAATATGSNKAVIVFTDGEDTDGGVAIQDIAARCASTGVRVFTVGLGTGTRAGVLSEIAHRCQGAVMQATDARQLVAMYGSLGAMLNRSASVYRTRWSFATVGGGGCNCNIPWLATEMRVTLPGGTVVRAPLYVALPVP